MWLKNVEDISSVRLRIEPIHWVVELARFLVERLRWECLCQLDLLEDGHRPDLSKRMKRGVEMKPFLDDGHKEVQRGRDPELRLHRVLGGTEGALDSQMLLAPLEEPLHLPAVPIPRADGLRRQAEVVGQKHQSLAGLLLESVLRVLCSTGQRGISLSRGEP